MNQWIYEFALWVDGSQWSTMLHESYYMYNWVEATHVLSLTFSLGLLFLIDLRVLGYALPNVSAVEVANRLHWPMLLGFSVMIITGLLLFYAIPVRSAQSIWFRVKLLLLVCAAINALLFHKALRRAAGGWSDGLPAPRALRRGAGYSLLFWTLVVICGRFIAYDWFDCVKEPHPLMATLAGCVAGQEVF
ncbi:MAG: DUF6644 family protein [Halieaceae bacterium]